MNPNIIIYIFITSIILLSGNCKDKDEFKTFLYSDKQEVIFKPYDKIIDTLNITSNTSWFTSTDENWITLTPQKGNGNGKIIVAVDKNQDTVERNGNIKLFAKEIIPIEIKVKQQKNTFFLNSSRKILNYTPELINDTFKVLSNTRWKIINNNNWIIITPDTGTNNKIINLSISSNPISTPRKATLKVIGDLTRDTVLLIVNQQGKPCQLADEKPCYIQNCYIPTIPSFNQLENNNYLPDPFKFLNGIKMTSKDEWKCRRQELMLLAQEFELGYKPCTPYEATTGKFKNDKITVTVTDNGKTISFDCAISYPPSGKPPFPAMIGIGYCLLNMQTLFNNGVAIINIPVDEIAEQKNTSSRGKGKFYNLYCNNHSAGALMAWAWAVSRLIDALEKTPEANIDTKRIGVTGCSRYGKGALVAGAFDERIILTIPQESGSGGAANWRVSDYQKNVLHQNVQTLSQIVTENCWFRSNFSQFSDYTNKLPFDHHSIAGLIAPRALLIIENTAMEWLGNLSTYVNAKVAQMIWKALGETDKFGFSQYGHNDHCVYKDAQLPELEAFIKKFLVQSDKNINTTIFKTDGNFIFDSTKWVNWSIPILN